MGIHYRTTRQIFWVIVGNVKSGEKKKETGLTEWCHEAHQDHGQQGLRSWLGRVLPYCLVSSFSSWRGGCPHHSPSQQLTSFVSSHITAQESMGESPAVGGGFLEQKEKECSCSKGTSRHTLPHCSFLFLTPFLALFLYKLTEEVGTWPCVLNIILNHQMLHFHTSKAGSPAFPHRLLCQLLQ